MILRALAIASSFAALSSVVDAQVAPRSGPSRSVFDSTNRVSAGCPGGNGIHITTKSGALSDSSSGSNTLVGLNQSIDTTLVFDISRKTWTLTNLSAAISVGLADETRGRYAICAGVTALMPSATLTISGARGRVHFVASLKELTSALRLAPVQ